METPSVGASNLSTDPMDMTETAEAAFEAEGSKVKRKRRRIAKSCLNCRQRKVKCDRVIPCMQCCLRGQQDSCTVFPTLPDAEISSLPAGAPQAARATVAATATATATAPLSWYALQQKRGENALSDVGGPSSETYKAEKEDIAEVRWSAEAQDSRDEDTSLFSFSKGKASYPSPSLSMSSMPPPPRRRATVHGSSGILDGGSNELMWTASVDSKLDRLEAQLDRLLESVESLEQNLVKPYTQQYWPSTVSSPPLPIPYAFPNLAVEAPLPPVLRVPASYSLESTLTSSTSPMDTSHFNFPTPSIASSSSASTSMPSLSADSSALVSPISTNLRQFDHHQHHLLQQQQQIKYAATIPVNAPFPNTSSSTIAAPVSYALSVPSSMTTLTSTTDNNWTEMLAPPVVSSLQPWTSVTTN